MCSRRARCRSLAAPGVVRPIDLPTERIFTEASVQLPSLSVQRDLVTVAAQTGTSIAMIEKAYLRFIPSAMQEKLAALKA